MPRKLDSWGSWNQPYGSSYSVEPGLWYNDDTEEFPVDKSTALKELKITPIITEKDYELIDDNMGIFEYSSSCEADLKNFLLWLQSKDPYYETNANENISMLLECENKRVVVYYTLEEFSWLKNLLIT